MKFYNKPVLEVKEVRSTLDFAAITDGPLADFLAAHGALLDDADQYYGDVYSYTYSSVNGLVKN
ncbi:MAG: hypothetical protein Q4C12_08180 [Clostridia bacterium]|nr:hypothetical protein [Clostridia bacterium]